MSSPLLRHLRLFFRLHPNVAINAVHIRAFLHQLMKHLPGNAVIMWDRLKTHRAGIILAFVAGRRRFRMEYLPPYVPELNPVE